MSKQQEETFITTITGEAAKQLIPALDKKVCLHWEIKSRDGKPAVVISTCEGDNLH